MVPCSTVMLKAPLLVKHVLLDHILNIGLIALKSDNLISWDEILHSSFEVIPYHNVISLI